jgi:hypothetical protein
MRKSKLKLKFKKYTTYLFLLSLLGGVVWFICRDDHKRISIESGSADIEADENIKMKEDKLVKYPGRSIDYNKKFRDGQDKQLEAAKRIGLLVPPRDREDAAKMKHNLTYIHDNANYCVDSLTHSIPYLVPAAAAELERIGEGFADILQRNGLPHYRFYVTSVLRTQADVSFLQKSGNVNATSNSCHCYGTTFDLAYYRYDKVTRTNEYMHEDNLKLVLGQVLLNEQRAGRIYVKYEKKQACFHITVRE